MWRQFYSFCCNDIHDGRNASFCMLDDPMMPQNSVARNIDALADFENIVVRLKSDETHPASPHYSSGRGPRFLHTRV